MTAAADEGEPTAVRRRCDSRASTGAQPNPTLVPVASPAAADQRRAIAELEAWKLEQKAAFKAKVSSGRWLVPPKTITR